MIPESVYYKNDEGDMNVQYLESNSFDTPGIQLIDTNAGGVDYNGYRFHKSGVQLNGLLYYRCSNKRISKCKVTLTVDQDGMIQSNNAHMHNHPPKIRNTSSMSGKVFELL